VQELLNNLAEVAAELEKAADDGGSVRYIARSRFERSLYLVLKEYCATKLGYQELGGLADSHKCHLLARLPREMRRKEEFQVVMQAFEIYQEVHEYCTAHIYCPTGSVKLGGDAARFLRRAVAKTRRFIENVRESA